MPSIVQAKISVLKFGCQWIVVFADDLFFGEGEGGGWGWLDVHEPTKCQWFHHFFFIFLK